VLIFSLQLFHLLKQQQRFAIEEPVAARMGVWGVLRYTLSDGRTVGLMQQVPSHLVADDGSHVTSPETGELIEARWRRWLRHDPVHMVGRHKQALQTLKKFGERVEEKKLTAVIFPEGTRSRKKMILPFHQGVGYLAINFGVPVIPVYISNSNKRFVSLVLRINKLKIKFGKMIFPRGYKRTRKDFVLFANRVRDEMLKLK